MDTAFHYLLPLVEALVPVGVLVRALQPRLRHYGHDLGVLELDLLDEGCLASALNIRIIPALHLPNVLILRIRHPDR